MITRRSMIAGAAGLLALPAAKAAAEPSSLADAAARAGLLYGASMGEEAFADPNYAALYRRETRILTTENALKFDWLRPTPDRFEFRFADAILREA